MKKLATIVLALVMSLNVAATAMAAIDINSMVVQKDYTNFYEVVKYNGKDRIQNIKFTYNNKVLNSEQDFTVKYENNLNVGVATVYYTGIGQFEGVLKKTFRIVKMPVDDVTLKATYNDDGTVTASANNGSEDMVLNKDYTYKYNVDVDGNVVVTFTGIGDNYTGVGQYIIANKNTNIVAARSYLKKMAFTKAKNIKKKKISLKWKKVSKVEGYELCYYKKGSSKKTTKKLKSSVKTYTIKSLKKNATYKVKIRCYLNYQNKKYNSKWSAISTIKIAK